jgi:hypothetical protein
LHIHLEKLLVHGRVYGHVRSERLPGRWRHGWTAHLPEKTRLSGFSGTCKHALTDGAMHAPIAVNHLGDPEIRSH